MKSTNPNRIRDTVYVVGAGFSAGLGYPLTKNLLIDVWERLRKSSQEQLRKIIAFHHPAFNARQKTTFPDIEQLLTEIVVNLNLFAASRPAEGGFKKEELEESREELLFTIAQWFHELYPNAGKVKWLSQFVELLRRENAAIVSFNWDLVLDHRLFGELNSRSYGLPTIPATGPVLLKPHGSLNWYDATQIRKVAAEKHITIFQSKKDRERIEAFRFPRAIRSKSGNRYTPLVVPPSYLKNFDPPIFQRLWNCCTEVISTPKTLIFLGYSLPAADLQAQFIFRCGFYNQLKGRLKEDGNRYDATGPAKVIIVNPDQEAARRIEVVAGPEIHCVWIPKRIEDWLSK